jgi:hypothetical protein
MSKKLVLFSFIVTLMYSTLSSAELSDDSVELLFTEAKLQTQINNVAKTINDTLEATHFDYVNVNADEIDIVFNTILNLYKADVVRQKIKQKLQVSLNAAQAQELVAWFQSDLGQRQILVMQGDKSDQAMVRFEEQAEQLMADTSRRKLAQELLDGLMLDRFTVNVYSSIAPVVNTIKIKVANPFAVVDPQQVRLPSAAEKTVLKSINEKLVLYILGSFADFSEQEFKQMVTQTLSPTGSLYHKTVNTAFEAVMSEASVNVTSELSGLFNNDGWTLKTHLALRIPEGEDLTYQEVEDFEEKQLIAWKGQEPIFFVETEEFKPVAKLKGEWEPLETALKSYANGGEIEKIHSGEFLNTQGHEVQFAVYVYNVGGDTLGQIVNLIQSENVAYMVTATLLNIDHLQDASIRNIEIMKSMYLLK